MAAGRPLIDVVESVVEERERNLKVIEYWDAGTGWKWSSLGLKLSFSNTLRLALVALSPESEIEDLAGWLSYDSMNFKVKKAYELARPAEDHLPWPGWKLIWKIEATQ